MKNRVCSSFVTELTLSCGRGKLVKHCTQKRGLGVQSGLRRRGRFPRPATELWSSGPQFQFQARSSPVAAADSRNFAFLSYGLTARPVVLAKTFGPGESCSRREMTFRARRSGSKDFLAIIASALVLWLTQFQRPCCARAAAFGKRFRCDFVRRPWRDTGPCRLRGSRLPLRNFPGSKLPRRC